MPVAAAVIVVPASLVVRLTEISDTNETVLLPAFGILGSNQQVITQVGGTPLGFPNREPDGFADARCAFGHTFDSVATDSLADAVPEVEVLAALPDDWRSDGGI